MRIPSHKGKVRSGHVWARKDINFSVNHGDTVGVIGRNGAGQSDFCLKF